MSAAILNSVTQTTYAYDADELRIVNTNSLTGHVTHYVYDAAGQLIAEMNGATGAAIREYIWLGGLPIGYVDRLGSGGASRLFFIHADHLARPQKITDGTRTIVWDGVFAPFGEVHAVTGSIVNVLMFPGQVYDPETGLSQNWHRDYDANIGRYLQSDPIGLEGGINTYAYVGGNPTANVDPQGLRVPGPGGPVIIRPPTADPRIGPPEPMLGPRQSRKPTPHKRRVNRPKQCVPFEDCEQQWEDDIKWCEKNFPGWYTDAPGWSNFKAMKTHQACRSWANEEFERCKKGEPSQSFRFIGPIL